MSDPDVWSQLDTTGANQGTAQGTTDVWAQLDHPSAATQSTSSTVDDPDRAAFIKQQGRAPTQDELASIRAVRAGNPVGAVMDTMIGGPLRAAVGGWRGILDLARGKSGSQAASDIQASTATEAPTSPSGKITSKVLGSPYNPLNWTDAVGQRAGDFAQDKWNSPALSTLFRVAPDAAAMALGLRRGAAPESGTAAEPEAMASTNPYRGAVAAEQARLQDIHGRGVAAGLDLPESGTQARFSAASANNTPVANSIVRRNFGLPDNPDEQAPLTPQMMSGVRAQVAKETFGPVRAEPTISLSADATDAIDALPPVIRNRLKLQGRPLSDTTPEQVSGDDFVNLSQRLRSVAKTYDKAFNISGNPESGALADLTHDAVDAWEESGRDSLKASGKPEIAAGWDAGRKVIAQTHDVEATLDGAGNVNVAALRKRPYLTGDLDMLANLGGRYPDAFKVTRLNQPQPGVIRGAAAGATKMLTTAGGAAAGGALFGLPGAAGGAGVGKIVGERIAGKISPP